MCEVSILSGYAVLDLLTDRTSQTTSSALILCVEQDAVADCLIRHPKTREGYASGSIWEMDMEDAAMCRGENIFGNDDCSAPSKQLVQELVRQQNSTQVTLQVCCYAPGVKEESMDDFVSEGFGYFDSHTSILIHNNDYLASQCVSWLLLDQWNTCPVNSVGAAWTAEWHASS